MSEIKECGGDATSELKESGGTATPEQTPWWTTEEPIGAEPRAVAENRDDQRHDGDPRRDEVGDFDRNAQMEIGARFGLEYERKPREMEIGAGSRPDVKMERRRDVAGIVAGTSLGWAFWVL
ncbi:hypothetical protein L484_005147 [Morus notabilis]|uniref:Uncharacterized protein n=1 Tax=Morus notabilis TaxID=981085 RepID=W9R0Z4_9ROSA|nr:hypothetical protein L484_005147 [Morus notabilis]